MTSYTSQYPNVPIDPAIKDFFEEFYATSDTPDAHEKYAKFFSDDATLIMGSKKAQGYSEILVFRKAMWDLVASRHHKPIKVFPYGSDPEEVMLHGTVAYGMKNGKQAQLDWSARAHLVRDGGSVKMDFYQVYLVRMRIPGVENGSADLICLQDTAAQAASSK
ncbi:MAG: hypothetical protein M1827_001587 [Pycnora praestabilis]|nr:MAG: hypothetical protein M1827_001587 [Pycnora praestabilis]